MFYYRMILIGSLALYAGCTASRPSSAPPAAQVLQQAEGAGESTKADNARAAALLEQGQLHEAEQILVHLLSKEANFGPARNNLGKVYYLQSQMYLAAREFKMAAALLPTHPEPRNNLGLVCESIGHLDQAVSWYTQASRLGNNAPQFTANLARARLRRGDTPEDVRELLVAVAMQDSRPAWVQWAKQHLARLQLAPEPPAQ